jgi:hypothetical protein
MAPTVLRQRTSRVPLLTLIHPRDSSRLFLTLFLIGILLGWLAVTELSLPVWAAVVITGSTYGSCWLSGGRGHHCL